MMQVELEGLKISNSFNEGQLAIQNACHPVTLDLAQLHFLANKGQSS